MRYPRATDRRTARSPTQPPPNCAACSTSWRPCATPTAAARGTPSRISPPSPPTRSRKPTKSPTPSSGATSPRLPDELGDLLFQVVYHARMAEEEGRFGFADVARAIADKMVRRHPHVFGDAAARTAGMQVAGVGGAEARRARRPRRDRHACRHSAGPAGADPRGKAHPPGRPRRLRLAGRRGGARKARRGSGRTARRVAGGRPGAARRRVGRPAVRDGQPRPQARAGRGNAACATPTGNSPAASAPSRQRLADDGRTPAEATLAEMESLWQAAKRAERE